MSGWKRGNFYLKVGIGEIHVKFEKQGTSLNCLPFLVFNRATRCSGTLFPLSLTSFSSSSISYFFPLARNWFRSLINERGVYNVTCRCTLFGASASPSQRKISPKLPIFRALFARKMNKSSGKLFIAYRQSCLRGGGGRLIKYVHIIHNVYVHKYKYRVKCTTL